MSEELDQTPVTPPAPPLEGLLRELITEMKGLRADNESLKKEQASLREQVEQAAISGPGVQHSSDPTTPNVNGTQYARRVTIITRPVTDAPELYNHVINPNDLRLPSA